MTMDPLEASGVQTRPQGARDAVVQYQERYDLTSSGGVE